MKIVFLDIYTLKPDEFSWDGFDALGEVVMYDRTSSEELMERAEGAEILLTNKTVLDAESICALPSLKYIGVLATGYNVVDLDAARERGIVVTNIPAYSTSSVAQMVFAHLLTITQRVEHYTKEVRRGAWNAQPDFCFWDTPLVELDGKKMGIIGFGNTGKAVAGIASAFGMKVCLYTSKPQSVLPDGYIKKDLDDIFRECDVISLHCPLTSATSKLVNTYRIALMKKGAILINTSRGGVIDDRALAEALADGQDLWVGLDVMSEEPMPDDHPLLAQERCFITPHIAWATHEARQRLIDQALMNLKSWMEGNVINNVI
ncbi:D-2-hydroxyacid dehydrogenase [uncultured Bacteroides sp.]|uniref:D-2-hydroxyacid dehydrogenase n=1 Tax=uncultured Bacteroides sp. TaxID=162156 RepID=UPI00261DDAC4|nr:D-2-hydroxyacid dehydrogenase [uncultured Bacteroides sp.]